MKVARQKPAPIKSPVYVTPDKYEIWYCAPKSLGTIDKRGGYWYTTDGMRFVSSRDAMEYLIRMQPEHRPEASTTTAVKVGPSHHPSPITTKTLVKKKIVPVARELLVNQNHPKFQEFLDYMEYSARRKGATLNQSQSDS